MHFDSVSLFDELFVGHVTTDRICRLRHCRRAVFLDTRVNEYREWCSDEHMRCAVQFHKHSLELAYFPIG